MKYGYDDYDELELQEIYAMQQAESIKQAEEYFAEQEWIEHMMYEEQKKHQPTREERFPGVIFTPRKKITTIDANDDIAF